MLSRLVLTRPRLLPDIAKETVVLGAGYFLTIVLALVGNRVLTEIVSPHMLGTVALAQTTGMLLAVWPMGILLYLARYYSVYKQQNQLPVLFSFFTRDAKNWSYIVMAAGVVCLLLGCFGICRSWIFLFAIAVFGAVPGGWYSIFSAGHNAARRRTTVAMDQVLFTGLRPLVAALFAFVWLKPESILFAYLVLSLVVFIVIRHQFCRHEAYDWYIDQPQQPMPLELKEYRNHMLLFQAVIMLQPLCERWILDFVLLRETVGIYVVALGIAVIANQAIGSLVSMVSYPIIFEEFGDNTDLGRLRKGVRLISCLFLVVAVGFLMLNAALYWKSDLIVALLLGSQYHCVKDFLWKLFLSQSLFQITIVVFLLAGQALRKTAGYVRLRYISVAVYLVVGTLWTCSVGIQGMANASLLANGINFALAACLTVYLMTQRVKSLQLAKNDL